MSYVDLYYDVPLYGDGINYLYSVQDFYVQGNEFIPGTVIVSSVPDLDIVNAEYVCTLIYEPENPEDYDLYITSEIETNDTKVIFIALGRPNCSNADLEEMKASLPPPDADGTGAYSSVQLPVITRNDSFIYPGNVQTLSRVNVTDFTGRQLLAYRYTSHYFVDECRLFIIGLALIYYIAALILALLISRKRYLQNKYICEMNDYRKCLMDSMAHDLRTPLTVMGGYAQNLAEDVNGEKKQYYADSIVKNVDYMNKIITDNLEMSRLAQEDIAKDRAPADLIAKTGELFEKYKAALSERNVELTVEGTFMKKVNATSIETALENLASNAVKYVNDGGRIRVYAEGKTMVISNTTSEKFEGKLSDLWKPFVKGDKSRGNAGGTGLGLAIAKRVMDINKVKASIKYNEAAGEFMIVIR